MVYQNGEVIVKVAICGKMRSGKDTVANVFKENHKFTDFRFSEGIHAVGKLVFPEQFNNPNRKPRKLLQGIGQQLRQVEADVWVNYTLNCIEEVGARRVIVTDLRQSNEYKALKEDGFFIIRVNTEPEIRLERARVAGDNFEMQDLLHETEKHLDQFQVDFDIDNNGSLHDFYGQINKAIEQAFFKAQGLEHYQPKGGNNTGGAK